MKKTEGGVTTIYVNRYYEKSGTTVTTCYFLGGKLVANRVGTVLSYILQDHLGSTSVTASSAGATTSTIRYFGFGATRVTTGTIPTDKKFTGQRLDATGLYFYNARYYDATIGRFISADTIVPNPAYPQSLNRYSYCYNNPLKYNDPSGHKVNCNGDKTLVTAWEMFKNLAPNVAQTMEEAKQTYNLEWIRGDSGKTRLVSNVFIDGVEVPELTTFAVQIPEAIKDNIKGTTMVIAHETVHCLKFKFFPNEQTSRYEEAVAFQFAGWIGNQLGHSPSRSDWWLNAFSVWVAGAANIDREKGDFLLSLGLKIGTLQYSLDDYPSDEFYLWLQSWFNDTTASNNSNSDTTEPEIDTDSE